MSVIRQLFTRNMLICIFTGFASGLPLYLLLNLLQQALMLKLYEKGRLITDWLPVVIKMPMHWLTKYPDWKDWKSRLQMLLMQVICQMTLKLVNKLYWIMLMKY